MEAVMHGGLIVLDCSSSKSLSGFGTGSRNNGGLSFKLKKESCHFASVCSFRRGAAADFSFGPVPSSEWPILHLHSPPPSSPSHQRRRVNCLGQRTINAPQPSLIEEQKLLLKKKAAAVHTDLRGTCIFLVGMMGSGKSTVGKYVADALSYEFCDSDKVVEDFAGETVKQMFRDGREEEFRDAESEAIMQLSSGVRLVVATGGGVVVRPQNWGYLRQGITVWLDVPVEALAERVVAVGCESRPLLGPVTPETAYHQALNSLENLFEERVGYYENADASVCVKGLATMIGLDSVSQVTPTMLAVQVLEAIATHIRCKKKRRDRLGNL